MTFIRIGTKSPYSYTKVTIESYLRVLFPLIKMKRLSRNFSNSISTDILEMIYWSEDKSIHGSEIERFRIRNNSSSNCSKSSSIPPDNQPILQSKYHVYFKR